ISSTDFEQLALAVIGGYRGRFPWSAGFGSGSEHDGLFVAVNAKFLRGFVYGNQDIAVRLNTDHNGLIQDASNIVINNSYTTGGSAGSGFALDAGVEAVIDRWEIGAGAYGMANRINWTGITVQQETLASVTQGGDFVESTRAGVDARVTLPVDFQT